MGKPKGAEQSERVTFTKVMTRSKRFMPGVGSYQPNFDFVVKPYARKRM